MKADLKPLNVCLQCCAFNKKTKSCKVLKAKLCKIEIETGCYTTYLFAKLCTNKKWIKILEQQNKQIERVLKQRESK